MMNNYMDLSVMSNTFQSGFSLLVLRFKPRIDEFFAKNFIIKLHSCHQDFVNFSHFSSNLSTRMRSKKGLEDIKIFRRFSKMLGWSNFFFVSKNRALILGSKTVQFNKRAKIQISCSPLSFFYFNFNFQPEFLFYGSGLYSSLYTILL